MCDPLIFIFIRLSNTWLVHQTLDSLIKFLTRLSHVQFVDQRSDKCVTNSTRVSNVWPCCCWKDGQPCDTFVNKNDKRVIFDSLIRVLDPTIKCRTRLVFEDSVTQLINLTEIWWNGQTVPSYQVFDFKFYESTYGNLEHFANMSTRKLNQEEVLLTKKSANNKYAVKVL